MEHSGNKRNIKYNPIIMVILALLFAALGWYSGSEFTRQQDAAVENRLLEELKQGVVGNWVSHEARKAIQLKSDGTYAMKSSKGVEKGTYEVETGKLLLSSGGIKSFMTLQTGDGIIVLDEAAMARTSDEEFGGLSFEIRLKLSDIYGLWGRKTAELGEYDQYEVVIIESDRIVYGDEGSEGVLFREFEKIESSEDTLQVRASMLASMGISESKEYETVVMKFVKSDGSIYMYVDGELCGRFYSKLPDKRAGHYD